MAILHLPDGELFYRMKGTGASLLLLHAGIAESRMWDAQLDDFAEHFQVICCDLRGHGRSLLPNGPFAHHDDVRALIGALHIGPTWIVGASFGAQVAVDVTLAFPNAVKGLILVAPVVSGFQPTAEVKAFNDREDALFDAGKLDEATELNLRMWVVGPYRSSDAVDPAMRAQVGEMQRHIFSHPEPEHVSVKRLHPPALDRLHTINCPVLIMSGGRDVPEFLHLSEVLVNRIPGAQRMLIPEVAHMLSLEVSEQFTQAVSAFILAQES